MVKKPSIHSEYSEVIYNKEHWSLLETFRLEATQIMASLETFNLRSVVHGSVARGDISRKSDIDIFIPKQVSSFIVETALERAAVKVDRRLIVQATPTYGMKAYIETDENTTISFPLMKMRKVEREFYRFGGQASMKDLKKGLRVPGIDKRLMLIEPTHAGHRESTIIGHEERVAKLLGISTDTVLNRVHTLLRRGEVGRTGVFIERELSDSETFEKALENLAGRNPAVRRRLKL